MRAGNPNFLSEETLGTRALYGATCAQRTVSLRLHSAITSCLKSRDVTVSTTSPAIRFGCGPRTRNGKQQTRAYSIASAASGNKFELCVNRVRTGSSPINLADLTLLPVGATIQIMGRTATSCCRSRSTDSIFVATGTGVARCALIFSGCFPLTAQIAARAKTSGSSTATPLRIGHLLQGRVRGAGQSRPQLPLPAHAEPRRRYLEGPARPRAGARCENHRRACEPAGPNATRSACRSAIPAANLKFRHLLLHLRAQLHGLPASAELLDGYGWHKKQVVFERYD